MMSIDTIKHKIYAYGNELGLSKDSYLYPWFSDTDQVFSDGCTVCAYDNAYHYVVKERGEELQHIRSEDPEDVLYAVLEHITFELAGDYEVAHRREGEDFRRLLFSKQLELLEKIDVRFKERGIAEIEKILEIAPFTS